MPFNVGETVFAWTHIVKGFDRRLKNQPRERYLAELQAKGLPIKAVLYEGRSQYCQLCGYLMAELCMSDGWTMHACSAIGFSKILNNQKHEAWLQSLSRTQLNKGSAAKSSSSPTSQTSLPTAGV